MAKKYFENPAIGDRACFIQTAEESKGECSILEVEVVPGGGPTPHFHKEFEETFRIIEGSLQVGLGKEKKILHKGESFTVPVNTRHYFKNITNKTVVFRIELRPGHTGFENCIKIAYSLAKDGLTNKKSMPKSFSHLALILTMSASYPSGPLSLLMPLFRWKAKQARKKGIEKYLIEKYCQ